MTQWRAVRQLFLSRMAMALNLSLRHPLRHLPL
jgi:hypothetical protein